MTVLRAYHLVNAILAAAGCSWIVLAYALWS